MGDMTSDDPGDEYPRATPEKANPVPGPLRAQMLKNLEKMMGKEKPLEPEPTLSQYCCPFCNGYITEKTVMKKELHGMLNPNGPVGPQPVAQVEVKTSTYTCSIGRDNCSMLELYRRSDK